MKNKAILLVLVSAICIFPQTMTSSCDQGQFAGKEDLPPYLSHSIDENA